MERQTTIKKLFFEEGIQFAIPSYQRAYSWEVDKDKNQVNQFILDIKEQDHEKKYFLGHFLFEKDDKDDSKFWVIDGQQRLTTIIIFFSCLIKELKKREKKNENGTIKDLEDNDIEIWRIRENYIQYKKRYKFETVPYDNPYFESTIFENDDNISNNTSSLKRISRAKEKFKKELTQIDLVELLKWKKIIDDAVITTFEVKDKVQATQIFAFQNDRGKDLTTLEKLKAFLMHKIYSVSDNENSETLIKSIEIIFSDIYKQIERISYNEDQVLNFHNIAFLKGWESPILNIKNELDTVNKKEKEKWIKNFVKNLQETFTSIETIEKQSEQNNFIADMLILDTYNSMPLLIKLFHYHKDKIGSIKDILYLIENILFKLEYKIADYRTNNLHSIAKKYKGNYNDLNNKLKKISEQGFQSWWNFTKNSKNYFEGKYHYRKNIKYILWKYENFIREQNRTKLIQPTDFKNKFGAKKLENTIDHITPQNPNFIEYSEEFKNDWLNNIGNLTLMVWGDNSEKRDNNPIEKTKLFDSDYYSHKEIRDVLKLRKVWGEKEIIERRDKINKFIFEKWELV